MSHHRHLSIKLKEAKGIPAADTNGKSDPYVIITLNGQKKKSKTIEKTLEPKWYEDFRLDLDDSKPSVLRIEVFDTTSSARTTRWATSSSTSRPPTFPSASGSPS